MEPRLLHRQDLAVRRGRDAAKRITDLVADKKAQGHEILSVAISRGVADALKHYFASFTQFDGVLPSHLGGAPLLIDLSASQDFVMRSRPRAN